ncbi:MAG: hypothetical protein GY822_13525 [Deltaproteobacteria bacterium]|nr:hypothetical protein [Deltaproteobacteria bacterium]
MKTIYTAVNVNQAEEALTIFEEKWKEYSYIAQSWRDRFDEWTPFFGLSPGNPKSRFHDECHRGAKPPDS